MILKCEKQCAVYNETAKSIVEILRESIGLSSARISLMPNSNDFAFDGDPNAPTYCKNGWVLVD